MKGLIQNLFNEYCFREWNDFKHRPEFDLAYINEFEAYLIKIYGKDPSKNDIDYFEQLIYDYIIRLSNDDKLKYHVNLIICFPFKETEILELERDKYTCRKYFLNTISNEELKNEFEILPFVKVNIKKKEELPDIDNIIRDNIGEKTFAILNQEQYKPRDLILNLNGEKNDVI